MKEIRWKNLSVEAFRVFGSELVNCLIVLPERTCKNDCTVDEIPADRQARITGEGTR
jgi:hypothetical protein